MKTGIFDLARREYDALTGAVNWSTLKYLGKSPAHYWDRIVNGDGPDTDARKRGRVTHLAVFEPEVFRNSIAVFGARRAGRDWEEFKARNEGKELLTEDMHEEALAAAKAVQASAMAAPYLTKGKREVTTLWQHMVPELGGLKGFAIDCKGRLDFLQDNAIVDLKSTRDASQGAFGRQMFTLEAHAQAAFYVDGVKAATGKVLPYVLVAVEAAPPYVVQVYRVPDAVLDLGRERYRALLDRLQLCRELNEWPGYAEMPMDLTLPKWAVPEDDDVTDLGLVIGGAQ